MEEGWLYLDAAGLQKGPLGADVLKRLLRKGLLQSEQLVWAPGRAEWAPASSVEPFASFWGVWAALWYFLPDEGEQKGPVTTQQLLALFADGEVDGMTMVWRKEMPEWQPVSEVPALKEFLQEANSEMDREAQLAGQIEQVKAADQVYEEAYVFAGDGERESSERVVLTRDPGGDSNVEAFVAEDGKQYVFDSESNKWITPEEKIEDDLAVLREAAGELDQKLGGVSGDKASATLDPKQHSVDPTGALIEQQLGEDASNGNSGDADTEQKKRKKKKKKKGDKWKATKKNTWVYVNGLPLDVTVQEVHDYFSKCGVIQQDVTTGEPRIKLYKNKEFGGLNGDASVCFMKEASVELAITLLHKSEIRPDWPIDVTPAEFKQKGSEFVKQKKRKIDARAKVKLIEQQKALSWNEGEDGDRAGLRIVVIKHMFTPEEISDKEYEEELEVDINEECAKIGEVSKITLFPKHKDGVVVIKFASSGSAATCVDVMNGRFFAGRKLECGFWDGTDYTHRESQKEEQTRADKFGEWLEEGSSSSEGEEEVESSNEETDRSTIQEQVEEAHAGRVLPQLDEDESDNSDSDDAPPANGDEIHAGRVMPDLDDLDGDDD